MARPLRVAVPGLGIRWLPEGSNEDRSFVRKLTIEVRDFIGEPCRAVWRECAYLRADA
jgi:hypothetical protein